MTMPVLIALIGAMAAATLMAPPPEPLAGKLRAAIWHDVELNGMVDNGNEVAYEWLNYWGDANTAPTLHLLDLQCRGGGHAQDCRFTLVREGGPIVGRVERIPDRIDCRAKLRRIKGEVGWEVPHRPPSHKGGHSRTTMTCGWAG